MRRGVVFFDNILQNAKKLHLNFPVKGAYINILLYNLILTSQFQHAS